LLIALGLPLALAPAGYAQSTGTIEGRVVDSTNGSPLAGANVVVEGTTIGASTNQNGRYQLRNVPTGTQTIAVSFVSYQRTTVTVDVKAGETVTRDIRLRSKVLETGEVVVTGLRKSQFRSVAQKKQAPNVVDVLSADDIGDLPEKNVAEAVQRLPGIVLRNDRTEGRFVSIRGGAANLNNVTLNGNTLASTAGSRATALDLLPAEMVSSVEVTKAVTPDMPGNAIGGSVNINTLSAFDRQGSFIFGTLRGLNHNQQVDPLANATFPFRANLTAGTKLGPDNNIGVLVSASGSRRNFTTSGLKGEFWAINNSYQQTYGTSLNPAVPLAQEQIVERNERQRFAVNTSFDWQPSPQTSVYLRPYYTFTDEKKLDNELEYNLLSISPFVEGVVDPAPTPTESGAVFPNGFGSVDLSDTDEEEQLFGGSLGIEQQFSGGVTVSASGTYSRGVLNERQEDAEFETEITPEAAGVADMSGFLFDFYPDNPTYVSNGENYVANEVDLEFAKNIENTYAAKADLRLPFQVSRLVSGFVKAGGQFQSRDKSIDEADTGYNYVGPSEGDGAVTLADFAAPRIQTVQVQNGLMPFADTQQMVSAFLDALCNPPIEGRRFSGNRACRAGDARYQILGPDEIAVSDIEGDSENQETIYAGYAMASADVGPLTALAGLRVERTRTTTERFQLTAAEDGGSDVTSQTFENAYTDFLPSVHLTLDATDNLQFRAAWTNTIGRPDYDELGAFSEVEITSVQGEPGLFEAVVVEGNPDLEPFRATNFDLSAEYYFPNGGLVSVAGFHKRIDNTIYRSTTTEENVQNPFGEGRTFRQVVRTQQRNANLGTVTGLELAYQQPFTFLPAPFNGLGLTANATIATSEVEVPSRDGEELPFFQQSDRVFNVIPYFQKQGFELRVAVNFQGDYLEGLSDTPLDDSYVDDRTTVDVNASYAFDQLPGQPELLFQGENLTNAPEVQYAGQESHLAFHYLSGRTVTLGLSFEF
jgi:TonB-dependent receptor